MAQARIRGNLPIFGQNYAVVVVAELAILNLGVLVVDIYCGLHVCSMMLFSAQAVVFKEMVSYFRSEASGSTHPEYSHTNVQVTKLRDFVKFLDKLLKGLGDRFQ